jgi:hypothetical protein
MLVLSNCTVISCCIYPFFAICTYILHILVNYTIFYCILFLWICEYHYALYVFHNFLAALYKYLT